MIGADALDNLRAGQGAAPEDREHRHAQLASLEVNSPKLSRHRPKLVTAQQEQRFNML